MHIDEDAIKEFQDLYLKEYGVQLTSEEALEYGSRLIRFVKTVYGNNLPKKGLDKMRKKGIP